MTTPETPPSAGGDDPGRGLSGVQRAGVVLGGLAVLLIVFVVLRGNDDNGSSSSSSAPQTTATSERLRPDRERPGHHLDLDLDARPQHRLDVDARRPPSPPSRRSASSTASPPAASRRSRSRKGDQVRLKVHSDTADEIHVHGYDLKKDVDGGRQRHVRPSRRRSRAASRSSSRTRARRSPSSRSTLVRRRLRIAAVGAALASAAVAACPTPRWPTASSASRTSRSRAGCSPGAAAVVLVVSFVALAVLWPKPRLRGRAASGAVCAVPAVARAALRRDRRRRVRRHGLRRLRRHADARRRTSLPTVIYVLFWVGIPFASAVFGDVFAAVQPVARARARRRRGSPGA